jgi:hypothetical protein
MSNFEYSFVWKIYKTKFFIFLANASLILSNNNLLTWSIETIAILFLFLGPHKFVISFDVKWLQNDFFNKNVNVDLQEIRFIVANILTVWWVIVITIQYGTLIKLYGYNNNYNTDNNSGTRNLSSTTTYYCNCNNNRRLFHL